MFTKRKAFAQYRKFNKQFIESFVGELEQAGLKKALVKLPNNLIEDGQDVISVKEFLDRGRNYPSLILIAENTVKNEVLKVLFVNIASKNARFVDDTFPSGHSEPPELFVQTPDPVRTHGLFSYFYEYLVTKSLGPNKLLWALTFISVVFFFFEIKQLTQTDQPLLASLLGWNIAIDILLIPVSLIVFYQFFSQDSGLFVKEREIKWLSLVRRALKGEYKDNPVANLIVVVVGGLAVLLIARLLGL